jgi:lipopolysaccharide/colanic/teichoic acid biosynthesis glycosyltransferase
MDTRYVQEWTFWEDLKIILKTIPAVLSRKGSY